MRQSKRALRNLRAPVVCRAIAAAVLLAGVLLVPACKRDPAGQLPEVSGEAIRAERAEVEGFALVRAWPDQGRDSLAIALEFSRSWAPRISTSC